MFVQTHKKKNRKVSIICFSNDPHVKNFQILLFAHIDNRDMLHSIKNSSELLFQVVGFSPNSVHFLCQEKQQSILTT